MSTGPDLVWRSRPRELDTSAEALLQSYFASGNVVRVVLSTVTQGRSGSVALAAYPESLVGGALTPMHPEFVKVGTVEKTRDEADRFERLAARTHLVRGVAPARGPVFDTKHGVFSFQLHEAEMNLPPLLAHVLTDSN